MTFLSRSRTALAASRPATTDVAVAAVCAVVGVLDGIGGTRDGLLTHHHAAAVAVGGLAGAVVVARRVLPLAMGCAVGAAHLLAFTPAAFVVAMYTLGRRYRRHRLALSAAAVLGLAVHLTAVALCAGDPGATAYTLAFVIGPLAVGSSAGLRHDLTESLRHEAERLNSEQRLTAEKAREHERGRIAREMHDVVSHRVSHIVLTAGALEVTARRQPGHVVDQAAKIRSYGQQALTELREILGVLNAAGPSGRAPRAPQPTLDDLPSMIDSAGRAGQMDISHSVQPGVAALPVTLQRTVYRVVQESLTNAIKHAPGAPVTITVRISNGTVVATVTNGPPRRAGHADVPGSGSGIIGLTERVRLLGGTLTAAPTPEGGFRTSATIPHSAGTAPAKGPADS
ncbi:sensor histidine kinase [Streptomyces sp. NPDC001262]|uniref:sensor histidine kinase n=1 Tax=unclassified Streptomyces TaxID=2593676 RepID=UPI00369705AF